MSTGENKALIRRLFDEVINPGNLDRADGLHAVDDQIAPFALAERLQTGIAGSKLIRFENSGHGPFYDERRKFNDEIMRLSAELQAIRKGGRR